MPVPEPTLPYTHYQYFFELPLYSPIKVTKIEELRQIILFSGRINAYNPVIKENTTYDIRSVTDYSVSNFISYTGFHEHIITCVRTQERNVVYTHFTHLKMELQKIGQYPSIADFHIGYIKKYDKVLNKEGLKEFTRAIGLAANGVGIGSFVYLRRIFESLLGEAYTLAKSDGTLDENVYASSRTGDKIELLKSYLPDFLVENKSVYSILSKGIHSLTEQECLLHYEPMKVAIELMLDEKVIIYEKNKKKEDAKKAISEINKKLSKE